MLKRIYHPINLWEEIEYNMWGETKNKQEQLEIAIKFTSNHKSYGKYMFLVIEKWKYSCENALTDRYINRKAWLGHAAVALAYKIPEDITREAWRYLTDEQQLLANKEAERAIQTWEYNQIKN